MAKPRLIPIPKIPKIAALPQSKIPLRRLGMRPETVSLSETGTVPEGLVATYPEWLAYEWLTKRGVPFDFQSSLMGGRLELGGAVADFVLRELRMVWRVQGSYWHYGDPGKEASDLLQRVRLEDQGYTVIDLIDTDILERRDAVCRDALRGIEWPRL